MDQLAHAAAALYEAFQAYPLRPEIPACSHCELRDEEAALHSRPLGELTWTELGLYSYKAMTTFGEMEDFKHFLPRILELHALDPERAPHDVSTVFEKLDYADWRSWPEPEVAAVRRFVDAWLQALLSAQNDEADPPLELEELRAALTAAGWESSNARRAAG